MALFECLPLSLKPGNNRLSRLCSSQAVDERSVAQQYDHRDAANAKTACQGGAILGIQLHDSRSAGDSFRNCPHRRRE